MTARFSVNKQDTRGHRPRLQQLVGSIERFVQSLFEQKQNNAK